VSQAESTTAHQEGGDARTLAGLYEKLRSWVLHPAPEAAPHPRLLGQAVLLRHGMREWMAAVSRLEGPAHQAPAGDATSAAPHLPTSTKAQLAAALANVVLTRLQEERHEP